MRLVTTTGDHITTRNVPGLNFDVADSLSEIKKAGFDGADLNLACYGHGIGIRPLDTPDWKKWCYHVKEASEKLELPILQAHAPFVSPTTEIEIEEWEEMINARTLFCAELLHIPIIVYHTYIVKEGRSISSSASKNKTIDTLLRFGEKCEEFGARIAIENNVPFYNYFSSPDDLISLVEELNSPVFGICWDFGHGHLSQVDVGKAIRAMGKHLIAMHANDNHAKGDFDEHLLPFAGTLNWEEAMHALHEIGYQGDVTLEAFNLYKGLPEILIPETMKYAEKVGRYLVSLIR